MEYLIGVMFDLLTIVGLAILFFVSSAILIAIVYILIELVVGMFRDLRHNTDSEE